MNTTPSPLAVQVGGNHYKAFAIQPVEFSELNGYSFLIGCAIKRVCRFDKPTGKGVEDLKKIAHEIELYLHLHGGRKVMVSGDLMPGNFDLSKFAEVIGQDAHQPIPATTFVQENGFGNEPRGSLILLIALAAIADQNGREDYSTPLLSAAWIAVVGLLRLAGVDLHTGEPTQ